MKRLMAYDNYEQSLFLDQILGHKRKEKVRGQRLLNWMRCMAVTEDVLWEAGDRLKDLGVLGHKVRERWCFPLKKIANVANPVSIKDRLEGRVSGIKSGILCVVLGTFLWTENHVKISNQTISMEI